MWRLVDKRVSARRDPAQDQAHIRRIGHAINASLREDIKRRKEGVGKEILGEEPPLHKEAWHHMKGWYRAAVKRAPPAAWFNLERITVERMDLYCHVPPTGNNIPVSVEPFQGEDLVPMEDEIEWEVRCYALIPEGPPK